ncbi:uncharacterized protein LOC115632610 [Scaptodrosophila lebanonensis]|uniref:Uncharacterized protein LOC115632610 n=1 Tax=Drosophila lebanonensis TaxID=7225 RepID=A0A6J2UE47_DROLE|nr:uncharacterized protein LOC115632610 [Scaptodrosophila lebanonensis]
MWLSSIDISRVLTADMFIYRLMIFTSAVAMCLGHLSFTNIICNTTDNSFLEFNQCYIKAVNRTHKYINMHMKLLQTPVDNVISNFKVMRNDNGYKPFVLDITYDVCKFLKNQRNPILNHFYMLYKQYSNMNHSCPYDCVGHFTFTNLKCNSTDPDFSRFEHCFIKAVNRSHKYISIHIKPLQKPINNLTAIFKIMRNNNGYKTFLPEITFDVCYFLENQRNAFLNTFLTILKEYSNLNHTCPYDHDLIIPTLWTDKIQRTFSHIVIFIDGDYVLYTTWYQNNKERIRVNIYFKVSMLAANLNASARRMRNSASLSLSENLNEHAVLSSAVPPKCHRCHGQLPPPQPPPAPLQPPPSSCNEKRKSCNYNCYNNIISVVVTGPPNNAMAAQLMLKMSP